MCLRMAHKLNSTVFDPTNIQRSSARMATSVFSDSTVHAMEYYSRTHPAWTGTFCFLKLVTEMWKIINVKTSKIGHRKKDTLRTPVHSVRDHRLKHLEDLAVFSNVGANQGKLD